jgi:hypothetical protein
VSDLRVILVTVMGPGGVSTDVGARADATPRDLAAHLGPALGIDPALPVVHHHAPQRPGGQAARQRLIRADLPLSESGVLDGDSLLFTPLPHASPVLAIPAQPDPG